MSYLVEMMNQQGRMTIGGEMMHPRGQMPGEAKGSSRADVSFPCITF